MLDRSEDQLAVRLLWFDSLWGSDPDEKGKVLLDATCSLVAFQRAIASGARAVQDEWGEASYRARWIDHDFPTATLVELESVI